MLKKIIFTIAFLGNALLFGQTGTLKGKVTDDTNGEGISFANVQLQKIGAVAASAVADINGEFTITLVTPGKYDLKAVSVGYETCIVTGLMIVRDTITYQDLKLKAGSLQMEMIVVVG